MKKMVALTLVMLIVIVSGLVLVACNGEQAIDEGNALVPPVVVSSGKAVSWNAVNGADCYDVYVNGQLAETVNSTFYRISDTESAEVYIVARGNNKKTSPRSNIVVCKGESSMNRSEIFENYVLSDGAWNYSGDLDIALNFVAEKQSKDEELWRTFERVFAEHMDNDGGYRSEFWGKTMRGAVLAYRYTMDKELYSILEQSVKNMMSMQEDSGRISGKEADNEFTGWDIWGRNYVIDGMLHFYSVCTNDELKSEILECCKRQLDYIMERVGDGSDDRLNILDTSSDWHGLPSTRIIQSALAVYCLTEDRSYLDYAAMIIGTDGCKEKSSSGNTIVEDCLAGTPVYLWGCRKFYEVTNFFDGILMYYMLTGDERAKEISVNYFNLVKATEITETGAIATDVEEVNNAVVEQADPDNLGRMQENCALVVWLRYCAKYYMVFDDIEAIECIEKAYYNIVLGTIDYDYHFGLPFFSYNPCGCTNRTDVYSGGAFVGDKFYSCCVAMGNAGLGLIPELSVMGRKDGISVNMYFNGQVAAQTPDGQALSVICDTELPVGGNTKLTLGLNNSEQFALRVRIPSWSRSSTVKVNGQYVSGVKSGEYCVINRTWQNGDVVELQTDMTAYIIRGSEECSNPNAKYNVVVKRGPIVFARDYRIEGDTIFTPVQFETVNDELTEVDVVDVNFRHQVAIRVKTADGYITLVDYGSAGKTMSDESIMCLWIPTVDYWSADLTSDVVVRAFADGSPNYWNNGILCTAQSYKDTTDKEVLSNFAWRFVPVEGKEGTFRIFDISNGKYITVASNGYSLVLDSRELDDGTQYFSLKTVGLNRYKILNALGKILTVHDVTLETYLLDDIGHELQYWYVEEV